MSTTAKTQLISALCIRTKMIGGGTSYDVYLPIREKGYKPISCGIYATTILHGSVRTEDGFYNVSDFLRTPEVDTLPAMSEERLHAFRNLEKIAKQIEIDAAKQAFPELSGRSELPLLWTEETHESAEVWIEIELDEKYFA